MFEKAAHDKWSGRKIYHWLKFEINFRTKSNHHLSLSNVYIILQNTFYYGVFEYPDKSGNWYNGKHEPLVTKDLFDQVQGQLTRDRIQRESKEFAFTKLITCALCGSGITADEKYKKLKDSTVARYVYYGCTRARDINCKGGYMREEELIEQLLKVLDKISLNELGIKMKFEQEVVRYNISRRMVLGKGKDSKPEEDLDIKIYTRYLLKEGSIIEKRELLANVKSQLKLKNKQIILES